MHTLRLVDQGRCLERVIRPLVSELGLGQATKLTIDQRQELLRRLLVARFNLGQDTRDVGHITILAGPMIASTIMRLDIRQESAKPIG